MGAQIQALYVETSHKLTEKEREQLDKNIKLAKQLGIKFRIITNYDIVKAIVDFASKRKCFAYHSRETPSSQFVIYVFAGQFCQQADTLQREYRCLYFGCRQTGKGPF